jgi:hypothetical protein
LTVTALGVEQTPASKDKASKDKAAKDKAKSLTAQKSPAKPAAKPLAKTATPVKAVPKAVAKTGTAVSKTGVAVKKTVVRAAAPQRWVPRPPAISAQTRTNGHDYVFQNVASGADIPVERSAALIPFFEQLYRHQKGQMPGPIRILHYGDSHTAADEWTGAMRAHFQEKFGDGGPGYSFAGHPWNGYRRMDVKSTSTRGWHTDGLVGRA